MCKHRIIFPSIQHLALLSQGRHTQKAGHEYQYNRQLVNILLQFLHTKICFIWNKFQFEFATDYTDLYRGWLGAYALFPQIILQNYEP